MHNMFSVIVKNNIEYKILPFQFFLLTFLGIWCPKNWSLRSKTIHHMYFISLFLIDFVISLEMFIYFISSIGTQNFKLINFFFVSGDITAGYKSLKFIRNREVIRSFIIRYFDYQWMKLHNSQEYLIYTKMYSRIRRATIIYFASMIGIFLVKALSPIIQSTGVSLPVDASYPYSIEESKWFWITYLHQLILGSSAICAHIGIDTLFIALLLIVTGQLNLLENRMKNLVYFSKRNSGKVDDYLEKKMILRCIYQHARIYRFGEELNNKFQEILIILVISSLPNICINVYSLSSQSININFDLVISLFCTTSVLLQFFLACWYGNETTLNSLEIVNAVYKMDWTKLNISTKKLLIFIMLRASKPLRFSVAYIIPMNLDSFIQVIKASYTTFNLLKHTVK